ncbi:MAG: carboxypeptidase regulatory-like domain-containing protein, partial [Acidobacteria bacterium]|nr:carboxypeptidase regulatory-like domain-containing protein [Acidobacteriota bacterium]
MRRSGIALVVLCFLFSINVWAQTSNASLGGTVSDASGAFIPGVEVTARNVGTGIVNTTLTNETGTYQFPSLQPGTYQVTAQLAGFQAATYNDVVLGGAQQVRLNFALRVGDVATKVDVTVATDTLLATTSASIASVLSESRVRELPLGNRNVLDLLAGMAGTGATEGDLDGYFAGNRLSAVNITLDGMSVSTGRYDQGTLGTAYMSPDLVEEVRVTTGTVDAERGRGSGQVAMVTRSGTNQFRGSAFVTNRNSALAASNWFNNCNSRGRDFENRNQY